VDADTSPIPGRKVVEDAVVQRDELVEKRPRGIELQGEPRFGEIDLHAVGTLIETLPNVRDGFGDEIGEEGLARVAGNARMG
jgi:hypothetical protein